MSTAALQALLRHCESLQDGTVVELEGAELTLVSTAFIQSAKAQLEADALSSVQATAAARPSLIPSLCIHLTRAGIEWRR